MSNPYTQKTWKDHIVDSSTGKIVQQGTPFIAEYVNYMEWGIWLAHERLEEQENEITRLKVQLELEGRVPGSSGAFFDTFDGTTSRLTMDTAEADIIAAVSSGATTIQVSDASVFTINTEVTLYDGINTEEVNITAISGNTLTVSALTNSYSKGAKVCRSNVTIDTTNKTMEIGTYTVYSITVTQ
jgi:hypothetical protein